MSDSYEVKDKWSISHWNFCEALKSQLNFDSKIAIHDQTLRDGCQFSGVEFSPDERVEIAERLGQSGVHRIEASRISKNPKDIDVVKRIVSLKTPAKILGFCEMSTDLVKVAADCGVDGVMLCFPSNNHAIEEKMGSTVEAVTEIAIEMAQTANSLGLETILFLTDASRSTPAVYKKMVSDVAAAAKFDALTFVDTIGGCTPVAIPHIVEFLRTVTDKPLEFHFHNDFGLATANTIAALTCGASTAHTTVLGVGERSGNASMEEVVTILRTMYGKDIGIDLTKLYELSHYVSAAAALPIAPNKPLVGDKIFEIECLENLESYIKVPEDIAIKYTFPYKWDLTGHPPATVAMGTESTMEILDYVLGLIGKSIPDAEAKKKALKTIQEKSLTEKRSFSVEEVSKIIDGLNL